MSSPLQTGDLNKTSSQKASTRRSVPAYLQKMNSSEKAANEKIIQSMQKKINYMKNPRYRINRPPVSFQQEATSIANNPTDPFRVSPEVITFTDYNVNCIYEIPLTITNASSVLKRVKYMPPASPQFSVSKIKFPSDETGIIAPGMSAVAYINFNATALSDFDDELMIVTEESSFKVKLQARREHPVLTLPEVLDCQGCWLGDRVDMAFQFSNKAGEASYKFFCEREEDDKLQSGDTLRLENFTIFPSEFSISKGEKLELFVCFTPKQEGLIEERVILACDNNTSKIYTLRAIANMAELKVTKVNGNLVGTDEEVKNLYMTEIQPKFPKTSVLSVKNQTFVKVNYHWNIQKDSDEDSTKHTRYKIEPSKGVFDPDVEIDFKVTFESDRAMPFYKNISLVIDDVPIEAIKNPPESIKQQALERKSVQNDENNNQVRPSLNYFDFSVISQILFNKVSLTPAVHFFPTPVPIRNEHQHNFSLKNDSEGPVEYKIRLQNKTSNFVNCRVLNDRGIIPAKSTLPLETIIWSDIPAVNQKCLFIVEIENCDPLAFQLGATFTGSQITLNQPDINFGLVKTHTKSSFVLQVSNNSYLQAEVLLKTTDQDVTFDDYKNNEDEPYYQWWDNLIFFEPQYFTLEKGETKEVNVILNSKEAEKVEQIVELLVLNGKTEYLFLKAEVQDIHVTLNRFSMNFPEIFTGKFYEIGDGHEQQLILSNYGNIPTSFEWPDIKDDDFDAKFEPASGVIPPKTEIPITLKMIPHLGTQVDKIIPCRIEGVETQIGFDLKAKVSGLNVVYELHEEIPLSQTRGPRKQGLGDSVNSVLTRTGGARSVNRSSLSFISKQQAEVKPKPLFEKIEMIDIKINEPRTFKFVLKNLSGLSTSYNLYSESFEPQEHKIDSLAEFKALQSGRSLNATNVSTDPRKKLTALSPNKGTLGGKKKLESTLGQPNQPLLTGIIEKVQNFTSVDGKALNQARRLERDQKFYLANDKGVAVVCDPYQGELKAYEEILINVTIYNDSCGKFDDFLVSEVKGLPKVQFPITLNVAGSPLIVTPNQVGVDYKSDYPLLRLEPRMHSLGTYTKQIKLTNTSPSDMNLNWKLYNLSGDSTSQQDFFNISFAEPKVGSGDLVSLVWDPIPPEESTNGPFTISPMITKMKARATEVFTISFSSRNIGKYDAVAVGDSELIREDGDESRRKSKTNPLPFYLSASTVAPFLTLDKLKRLDNSHVLKFEKWALTQAKKQRRNVILRNQTPAHLDFTIQIDGPFRILELKSSALDKFEISPYKKDVTLKPETRVSLRPEAFLEVLVDFEGFSEKDHAKWPLCPSMHIPGLIHITYANGDYQSFELEGVLKRPILQINTAGFEGKPVEDVIDFGVSHINNFVQQTVYLTNMSKVPAKWKLNYIKYPVKKTFGLATITKLDMEDAQKTDDPDVFEFATTEGYLGGKTVPVNKVPEGRAFEGYTTRNFNSISPQTQFGMSTTKGMMTSTSYPNHAEFPTKIMVNFKPKQNILYKSKFRITVDEGPSVDIILKGSGSYDERLEK